MIIQAIRRYFISCDVLDELRAINVDYLPADDLAYTIDPVPSDTIIKRYVDGGKLKQYQFVIASREIYGNNVIQNIENSGFYERLSDWIDQQNNSRNLPKLTNGKTSQKIEVLTSGYLFNATETKARYQIQLRLIYYEGR